MAIPQYAMPQAGSCCAIEAKLTAALSYQNECSIATAAVNCDCTLGSQETEKLTLPSFAASPAICSCCAEVDATNHRDATPTETSTIQRKRLIRFSWRPPFAAV